MLLLPSSCLDKAQELTENAEGKHFIGDYLPSDELDRFMEKTRAIKEGRPPGTGTITLVVFGYFSAGHLALFACSYQRYVLPLYVSYCS